MEQQYYKEKDHRPQPYLTPTFHLAHIHITSFHPIIILMQVPTSFSASPEPHSSSNWFTSAFLFCFSTNFFKCSSGVIRT